MWPNQGPPPPHPPYSMGPQNPAFPPGYTAPYSTTPGPSIYPQGPPPAYQGNPGYPACQYPSGHYPAPMNPAMIPHGPPGVMPHGPPAYPMYPAGHQLHPRGVLPGPLYYSPKGFGHKPYKGYNHHHHPDGFNSVGGILSGGMAVGMGILGHKANKKMRKKMKKAHKYHKHGHYKCGKSSSSSSSSDSD
ncbi:proline-rich protein 13-like [Cyprinodon tularosa]|uniref:proline-rich protein 13-like n=1 Tax=Cyprinodon tularosa TaxID=77115 RepID=UPI0018E1F6E3|nr:proline-rich protein 13-like [Cyprinodon tularosa]